MLALWNTFTTEIMSTVKHSGESPQGDEHRTCFLGVLEKRLDTYIRALFEVVLYKTNNALYASKIETMRYPKIMHSCSL